MLNVRVLGGPRAEPAGAGRPVLRGGAAARPPRLQRLHPGHHRSWRDLRRGGAAASVLSHC